MLHLSENVDTATLRASGLEHHDERAAVSASNVVFVVFNGVEAIDVAGPASVFAKAIERQPGRYRLHFASPQGSTVRTNAGLSLAGTVSLQALPEHIDTLVVAGGDEAGVRAAIAEDGVARWLSRVAPGIRRLSSVCTGAFVLAAAGLLDGREATTHWRVCRRLQSVRPQVRVQQARIYVHDGPVWTSAGVTTGIELALALVEEDLGHAVAMEIAQTLALPMLRGADQPQISPALQAQASASHRLRELLAWIATHLQDNLSVAVLAERAAMSPRHFARAFASEIGSTPARHVARARVAAAHELMRRTRWTQERIAHEAGFGSVDAMRRALMRERPGAPPTRGGHTPCDSR